MRIETVRVTEISYECGETASSAKLRYGGTGTPEI